MDSHQIVYLPDGIYRHREFEAFASAMTEAIEAAGLRGGLLKNAKNIWLRDYMPLEVAPGRFVQFRYEPGYLTKYPSYDPLRKPGAGYLMQVETDFMIRISSINLDGGNVVMNESHTLISDKLFSENPDRTRSGLRDELEHILQREVILLPHFPDDEVGHADGMARFLPDGSVVVNTWQGKDLRIGRRIIRKLEARGFETRVLPYQPYDNRTHMDATGIYINFLLAGRTLLVPAFGGEYGDWDEMACELLASWLPGYRIFPVDCNGIARRGGLLHCVTWQRLVLTETAGRVSDGFPHLGGRH